MKGLDPAKLVMTGDAVFDKSRRYRYSLSRAWNSVRPKAAFVMLNPSKADAEKNDPTISRCISFAENLGCGSLEVVNLFAYRTAYPHELKSCRYPVGKLNDQYIREAMISSSLVIVAWGNWGSLHGRDRQVLDLISSHNRLLCFGLTLRGQPRHPLFLPAQSELVTLPL
ncbi:MAG TPA: DUF1643 domain-containing protein [Candidatus Melainabacteria bacterium]|nr:DUF1643 domain-containing protein [Candidatus Melainabacteria bacterium]